MAQDSLTKGNNFNRKVYWLIFALVFLLYGNSIKNKYALDDNYVTVTTPEKPNNPRIEKGIKGIPQLFTSHYVETASQSFEYRPLVLVTFAIEYQFFGSNPYVSHFISILLYAITCVLLYIILSRLLKNYHLIFPLLIVFLFIIHPIHSEVVNNIKCRDELLSFLFGIGSLHFFIEYTENKIKKFVLLGILFLFLSLLCKRTAVLFIAVVPLTLYFFTSLKLKKVVLFTVFPLLAFVLFGLLNKTLTHNLPTVREFVFFENPLYYEHGLLVRIPVAFYTMGYYIKLLVFPYPLCCYYGYNAISMSDWASPVFVISLVLYVVIGIYALKKLPQKNVLAYGILIYLAGVFPFSNITQPVAGIVGERFIYFASFGFCIAAAYLLLALFKVDIKGNSKFSIQNITLSFKVVFIFMLLVCAATIIARNKQWKDELTLFNNDVKHFPNSCNLHYIIGNNLYPKIFSTPNGAKRDSIIRETKSHFNQAAELMIEGKKKYPQDYTNLNNLGTIYVNIFNDGNAAWPYLKRAYALNPKDRMIPFNYAFCYEKRNLPDSAALYYEKMIADNTTNVTVYLQLHEIYLKKQAYQKAIICDKKSVKQIPLNAQLYINLGNAYMLNKDTLNGVEQFVKATEIEPNNVNLRAQIVNFLKSTGYNQRAEEINKR